MYGKSGTSIHRKTNDLKPNVALSLGLAALLIAILGLFTPNANLLSGLLPANCSTGTRITTGVSYYGVDGADGISAYAVWQNQGNDGDEAAFLKSLVGKKGATGYTGKQGKSAYQLWLDAGNSGSSDDFLVSLVGTKGVDGVAGLSAYELWLSTGHNGTVTEFLASLTGARGTAGTTGANGSNGLSAYETWKSEGHPTATIADFLIAIKGLDGTNGTNGSNGSNGSNGVDGKDGTNGTNGVDGKDGTNGTNGTNGVDGKDGTNGTNGVDGAVGPSGPAGSPGPKGDNGVCTIGTGGYYASFWDQETQSSTQPVNGMLLGYTGSANGIKAVNDDGTDSVPGKRGSWIQFTNAGTYNLAFSAQLAKSGGSGATISIWLQRQNGTITNLPYTNTNIGLANNSTELVAAWNFFVDVEAGEKVRLAWHTTDSSVIIEAKAPISNGTSIPGVPSVIVTVNQVR